jgi:acyl-CoA thioester hydrolase
MVRVFGFDLGAQWITAPAAYLRFMDRGRVELIESLCAHTGEESWLTRYTINIYGLDTVFTGLSRFGDRLEVHTSLRQATSHRAAFDQWVYNSNTRDLLVDAVVEVLFLDAAGQLAPVPQSLAKLLGPPRTGTRPPVVFPSVRTEDEEQYTYVVPFRVYYEDTDAQGIAYHASYARFSEGALVETILSVLPREAVGEWLDPNRIHLSRLAIRFLRASRLGDYLEVQTRGRQPVPGEMLVEQKIILRDTDQVSAQVVMEVGFVDQEGRRQRVPKPLQDLVPYAPEKP